MVEIAWLRVGVCVWGKFVSVCVWTLYAGAQTVKKSAYVTRVLKLLSNILS